MRKITSLAAMLAVTLSACSGPDGPSIAPPEFTGVKIGKPYNISGKWYYPRFDESYDEVGLASWYGPGFHGKKTANGETFNQWDFTAAHTTLPLPSLVRVENLDNGRSMTVRINDRGPFVDGRIIDLSKATAEKLGITGLAKVRVRFLPNETLAYIHSKGRNVPDIQYAEAGQEFIPMDRQTKRLVQAQSEQLIRRNQDVFIPVPVQTADNSGPVADSAPLTSVAVNSVPPLVKAAYAEEAPYAPPSVKETAMADQPFTVRTAAHTDGALEPQVPEAKWAIQVASYSQRENAEGMMQKLVTLGQPQLMPVTVNGKQWYRVLLRPSAHHHSQQRLLSSLRGLGLSDVRVILP